jgi:hypothetical protein
MMVLAAWQIVPRDPISRKPITKRTGGVGQDVGPEFKPKEGRKEGGRKGGREGRRKEGRKLINYALIANSSGYNVTSLRLSKQPSCHESNLASCLADCPLPKVQGHQGRV